jgi:transcriptional regulator with XRE-family HTH domain
VRVGRQLKRRRTELQMSQREVAELTDLSVGFLSQLENDQVSPSLNSLERLAGALRTPIYEFLSSDERDPVVRASARPAHTLGSTDLRVQLLTNFGNWQMMPFYRVLAVGEKYEAVRIERAREEWMYVVAGAMEIQLTDHEPYELHEGDSIHFPSSRLETVNSSGDEPLELICMMTPPA